MEWTAWRAHSTRNSSLRLEMRAGDTLVTPAGEWHWHGAAPDRFVTHLAIWEASSEGGPARIPGKVVLVP
ncbi:MAG TPA: hypothetical protein VIV06_03095 [Candidatus Limnocylindrales bacterium]